MGTDVPWVATTAGHGAGSRTRRSLGVAWLGAPRLRGAQYRGDLVEVVGGHFAEGQAGRRCGKHFASLGLTPCLTMATAGRLSRSLSLDVALRRTKEFQRFALCQIAEARAVVRGLCGPRDVGCPPLGSVHYEVADRIFDVVVGVDIIRMQSGKSPLDFGVGVRSRGRVTQVVAKQQCVALVGSTHFADMKMCRPPRRWRAEVPLLPGLGLALIAWRLVVPCNAGGRGAELLEGGHQAGVLKVVHADL